MLKFHQIGRIFNLKVFGLGYKNKNTSKTTVNFENIGANLISKKVGNLVKSTKE